MPSALVRRFPHTSAWIAIRHVVCNAAWHPHQSSGNPDDRDPAADSALLRDICLGLARLIHRARRPQRGMAPHEVAHCSSGPRRPPVWLGERSERGAITRAELIFDIGYGGPAHLSH